MTMIFLLLFCLMSYSQEQKNVNDNFESKNVMLKMQKTDVTQSLPYSVITGGEVTYLVDFEGAGETKGSYPSGNVVLSGLNWNLTEVLIGTLSEDFKNGIRSARLRGYGASAMTMLEDKADGLGEITFLYRRYGSDAQVDWKVEYSVDQGVTWIQIGSDFTSPANNDVQTFSEEVNIEGNVRIRIVRATLTGTVNRRINIDDIQLTDFIICTTPVITNTTGDTICEGNTATLAAESNGDELFWFDTEEDGNLLGTGTTFISDPLTETTSFWVEARSYSSGGGTTQTGGARVAPTNTSSSAVVQATSPWGLEFTVEEDFVLNAVDVYLASANPGDLVVQLKDLSLNVLEEITIACPAGNSSNPVQFEIPLNWNVQAGNTYRLVAASSPVMVREFSGGHPGFPYPIGDVGTVTNGTINNAYSNVDVYYFFYNWTFTSDLGEVCISEREEVVAIVTPTPPLPIATSPQEYTAGQTLADLDVEGENLRWYEDPDGITELPESTPLTDGTSYYVSQTIDGCESELLAIQVVLVLSIDEHTIEGLRFYPNPVTNILNISAKTAIDYVEIYNLLGQKIFTQNLNSISGQIDLNILMPGSYFIKVVSGELSTTFKVLKR